MSETKTEVKTQGEASAKLTESIRKYINHEAKGQSMRFAIAREANAEASRLGYDRDQTKQMVLKSWRLAREFTSEKPDEVRAFDFENRHYVSKIWALMNPVSDAAQAALEKAAKHNDSLGTKRGRIGDQALQDITHGKLSFEDAVRGETVKRKRDKAEKAKREKQLSMHAEAENTKVPVPARFSNAFGALYDMFKNELTNKQMRELTSRVLDARK